MMHRRAELELKEAKAKMASQVKVLLLGSGDSGKSTVLKQMRNFHQLPFSPQEIEGYRQQIFNNLTHGLKYALDSLLFLSLEISEGMADYVDMIEGAEDIKDSEPYPISYLEPLRQVWADPAIREAWTRRNEVALPDNLMYFFSDLDRLFDPNYEPTPQDVLQCRIRTTGITETVFKLGGKEMFVVDVGGQKSERRKWIHCFQDVTCILFLVNLSGYNQCLIEDKDENQMKDAMTIWESICDSPWFRKTSIILFLNKYDLFQQKIAYSNIQRYFPDYTGPPRDVRAGRDYFRSRFMALGAKDGRQNRANYVHYTTATDTETLRVVMTAVEDTILRSDLADAAFI